MAHLERLLERTAAKVVLSSTWRYDPAGVFSAKQRGISFIDVTPDLPDKPRCVEILAWLEKHPNVNRFVVIDDEDDELDDLPLFQPSARSGLTEEICNGVAAYLAGETDRDMRSNRFLRMMQNLRSLLKDHQG